MSLQSQSKLIYEDDDEDDSLKSLRAVIQQALDIVNSAWAYIIQSLPQLIVFLLLIPVLFVLSLSAGWIVRKSVPVGWSQVVYLQYGDGQMPYATFSLSNIVADQPYHISVDLLLPSTQSNYALGNFMTTLSLFSSPQNQTIVHVRRPVVIPHPVPQSTLSRLFLSPKPSIELVVPLLFSWTPGHSSLNGYLEIGRKDGWHSIGNGEGREVTVLEASIRGDVNLKGTRHLIQSYPNISTIISAGAFFMLSLLGASICFISPPFATRRPVYKPLKHAYEPPPRRYGSEMPQVTISNDHDMDSSRSPSPSSNGIRRRRPPTSFITGELSSPPETPERGDVLSE